MEETTIRTKYVIEFLESKKSILEQMVEYSQSRMESESNSDIKSMFEGMRQGYNFGLQLVNDLIFVIDECAECKKRIHDAVRDEVQA